MKSIRVHAFGDSTQLQLEDMPRPRPEAGQVLVAVHDVGVNPVDWKIREGAMGRRAQVPLPYTVGQDLAGDVVECGPGVDAGFTPGERVFGFARGAYAEFAAVAADEIARMPEGMSYEAAAALPTPGVTAYQMVTEAAQVESGQSVLIHGAAGAVGSLAVQLARHRGARVLASDRGRDANYLRELGAEQVFDTRTQSVETAGPVDAVLDLVGGDLLARSYALVKTGGIIVTALGQVDEADAQRRGIRVQAFVMRRDGGSLRELARLFAQGVLRSRIAQVLTLPEARKAQDMSQQGATHGKIVLRVA